MKTAILTGATGFIGSCLVEELIKQKVHVTALVMEDSATAPFEASEYLTCIPYDPNHIDRCAPLVKTGYDVFYHVGWGGVSSGLRNNIDLQMSNIRSSLDVVQFAHTIGCRRLIGVGSVSEYVFADGLISPATPPSPANMYGAAKVSAHFLSDTLAKSLNLPFNWVILPSVFGESRHDDDIITYTIRSLLSNKKPSYTKLDQIWDFLYVADVAYALYLIAEKGLPNVSYGVGSGVFRPMSDYIYTIRDMIDPSLPLGIGDLPHLQNQTPRSCVDNTALTRDTGFTPQFSFEQGIQNTIHHFRNQ